MKVSIITVCKNAEQQIGATIASVAAQTFSSIEHVFIDGASTDRTVAIISAAGRSRVLSEPDDGIYPAMSKGVAFATGDVLFFLNSGDIFADPEVVSDVVSFFDLTSADAVFGNLMPLLDGHYDHPMYRPGKIIDQGYFGNSSLFFDESIHHQTMFYRRSIFRRCGFICQNPAATGEYHLNLCAFVREGLVAKHLPRTIAKFRLGGHSTSDFAVEWDRFSTARDILRRMFFPDGPPRRHGAEFFYYQPSLKNRLKFSARHWRLRNALRGARALKRLISAR
ncbi:glycosyltransferase family 2 protein [Bradyrhizobium sp. USDA 4529]